MCTGEMCVHLEGMLDRDLRTAKSPSRIERMQEKPTISECYSRQSCLVNRTKSCECSLRNLCHHLRKSLRKFRQALTVLLCLSYVFSLPTSSSHPVTKGSMNGGRKQLQAILNQAGTNTYQAQKYYNSTFIESKNYPDVAIYDAKRIEFFFEHTLEHFNFPNKSTFNESVLGKGTTVKEFTQIFYDCFLRYNATFDKLEEDNVVRNNLKVLLEEMKEYITIENIEPLKEKYDDMDLNLELNLSGESTARRWLRNLVIYRDFVKTMEYIVQAYEHFLKQGEQ